MTDEELDAVLMVLDYSKDADLPIPGSNAFFKVRELVGYFSALRAQLAEAREKSERLGRDLNVARYGQPDFAWQVHKEALAAANTRADRAEAALAAQIEADAAKYGPHANEGLLPNLGLQPGDRVVRVTGHDKWSDPDIGSEYTFCINSNYRKGVPHLIKDGSGWTTMTEKGTFRVIGRKPHDRTALERHDAKTREKALREAAETLTGWHPLAAGAILALINKEKTE